MQVREVAIHEIAGELLVLLKLHEQESTLSAHPCKPDWANIFNLNARGIYRMVGLFSKQDALIGYLAFFVMPSIHTCQLVATHDILFVRKDWRIGRGALLLVKEADRLMQAAGVREVFAGHQGIAQLGKLMEHVGYEAVGTQYYRSFPAQPQH